MSLPTAFLVYEECIYQTFQPRIPTPESPWTPLTSLIEGVWSLSPESARKILRQAIVTRYPLTPLCEGMLKVCGKRSKVSNEDDFSLLWGEHSSLKTIDVSPRAEELNLGEFPETVFGDPIMAMDLAVKLSQKSMRSEVRFESDRAVGAVLLDENGKILNTSWNTNAQNRTRHAELKLIQGFISSNQKWIPENSSLYVTLQPCAMCAAQIFTFTKRPESLKIYFLEEDPGPFAQNSVLVRGSDLWKKAGSPKLNFLKLS